MLIGHGEHFHGEYLAIEPLRKGAWVDVAGIVSLFLLALPYNATAQLRRDQWAVSGNSHDDASTGPFGCLVVAGKHVMLWSSKYQAVAVALAAERIIRLAGGDSSHHL